MNEELAYWTGRSKEYARQLTINGCATPLGVRRNIEQQYAIACKKVAHISGVGKIKKKYTG